MTSFDAQDRDSWYSGMVSREESNQILQSENENGVFLVRDSTSIKGDFVVCVKEDNKISHYIVNKITTGGSTKFRIGDQEFANLPSLLSYYTHHCLDTVTLVKPAQKPIYRTKYRFVKRDPDDLSFEKNEILTIIRKDEDQWWVASNSRGEKGLVPVPYIEKITESDSSHNLTTPTTPVHPVFESPVPPIVPVNLKQRILPAKARVIKNRDPNAYDKTALKLKVNDIIIVTSMNASGQWEGESKGQRGVFPFTHIKFLEEEEEEEDDEGREGGGREKKDIKSKSSNNSFIEDNVNNNNNNNNGDDNDDGDNNDS